MCGLGDVLSPPITKKIGYANRKSAKCHICRRSANLTNYLIPQICDLQKFICGAPIIADLVAVRYRRFLVMENLHIL
jgi:hypothetical protein